MTATKVGGAQNIVPGTAIELWAVQEIAEFTGMTKSSVSRRKWRGSQGQGSGLPPADLAPGGHELWLADTIRGWWATEQDSK